MVLFESVVLAEATVDSVFFDQTTVSSHFQLSQQLVVNYCSISWLALVTLGTGWGKHRNLSIMGTLITNIYQIWRETPFQITTFLKTYTHTRYLHLASLSNKGKEKKILF